MKYSFVLQKNIHMYNHELTILSGENSYRAIVESAPTEQETILIWLEDFGVPAEELALIKEEMQQWFADQGVECIFNPGKGR